MRNRVFGDDNDVNGANGEGIIGAVMGEERWIPIEKVGDACDDDAEDEDDDAEDVDDDDEDDGDEDDDDDAEDDDAWGPIEALDDIEVEELVGLRGHPFNVLHNISWLLLFIALYLGVVLFLPFVFGRSVIITADKMIGTFKYNRQVVPQSQSLQQDRNPFSAVTTTTHKNMDGNAKGFITVKDDGVARDAEADATLPTNFKFHNDDNIIFSNNRSKLFGRLQTYLHNIIFKRILFGKIFTSVFDLDGGGHITMNTKSSTDNTHHNNTSNATKFEYLMHKGGSLLSSPTSFYISTSYKKELEIRKFRLLSAEYEYMLLREQFAYVRNLHAIADKNNNLVLSPFRIVSNILSFFIKSNIKNKVNTNYLQHKNNTNFPETDIYNNNSSEFTVVKVTILNLPKNIRFLIAKSAVGRLDMLEIICVIVGYIAMAWILLLLLCFWKLVSFIPYKRFNRPAGLPRRVVGVLTVAATALKVMILLIIKMVSTVALNVSILLHIYYG